MLNNENHAEETKENPKNNLTGLEAKKYSRTKIILSIADIALNLVFIVILAFSGISSYIVSRLETRGFNDFLLFISFLFVAGLLFSIITLPLDFYSSYVLEHKYKLSNQTIFKWVIENLKSLAVGLSLGIPVALAFYYFLRLSGEYWWLYFSAFVFFFVIILARIAPVIIYPLFYKFKALENEEIRERITGLLAKSGMSVRGIFTFNMSKNTKKANAGFTGIGRSKRIILSDTLMDNFTPGEIEAVFAHELGHYKMRHIVKGMIFSGISIFTSFYICGFLYSWTLAEYGFTNTYDVAAIPILFFYLALFSLIGMPVSNIISRKYEKDADLFAVDSMGSGEPFVSALERLAQLNLSDKNPNKVIEFLFYSHPSIKKRVEHIGKYCVDKGIHDKKI